MSSALDIPPARRRAGRRAAAKPRLKRLRFVAILFAALVLGLVSFVFGIFISVASDLPSLAKFSQLKDAKSSSCSTTSATRSASSASRTA